MFRRRGLDQKNRAVALEADTGVSRVEGGSEDLASVLSVLPLPGLHAGPYGNRGSSYAID